MKIRIKCVRLRYRKNLLLVIGITFLAIFFIYHTSFETTLPKSNSNNNKIKKASFANMFKLLKRVTTLKKLSYDDPKLINHIKSLLVPPAPKDSQLQLEGCEL